MSGLQQIGININLGCDYFNSFDQILNSWAAYTDDSYELWDWLTLRAGLRYNHDNGAQKNALDQLRGRDRSADGRSRILQSQPNGRLGPTLLLPGSPNYEEVVNETRSQFFHNTATTGRVGRRLHADPRRAAVRQLQPRLSPAGLQRPVPVHAQRLDHGEAGDPGLVRRRLQNLLAGSPAAGRWRGVPLSV